MEDQKVMASVPEKAGYYKVFWRKNNAPNPINRLGGTDETGLLYIGESTNLRKRLDAFRRVVYLTSKKGHIAARKYKDRRVLRKTISKEDIFYVYFKSEDHKEDERRQLAKYVKKYGEVPPLNG